MWHTIKTTIVATLIAGAACLGGPVTANASDFEVVNGGTFQSLDAGPIRLVMHAPSGSIPLNCTASDLISEIDSGTFALDGVIGAAQPALGVPAGGSCTGPGGWEFTWNCSQEDLVVEAVPGVVADGDLRLPIDCTMTFVLLGCDVHVYGNVAMAFYNALYPNYDDGRLVLAGSGQSITVVSDSVCQAILPDGTGTLGSPGANPTDVGDLEFSFDPSDAPHPLISAVP